MKIIHLDESRSRGGKATKTLRRGDKATKNYHKPKDTPPLDRMLKPNLGPTEGRKSVKYAKAYCYRCREPHQWLDCPLRR